MDSPEEMLLAAIRVGPWPIVVLRELLRTAGVTERQWNLAVATLRDENELRMFQARFYARPSFVDDEVARGVFIEGHGREQLISRLSYRARAAQPASHASTIDIMQGEDAGRLSRESFERYGE
jgi:hypothetical protein